GKCTGKYRGTPNYGNTNKDIRQLIGKEIYYTGNLYDKDKRKSYQVKNVKIDISKSQNGITTIWLNNIHFKNFLKELWNTLQKTLDNGNWLHRIERHYLELHFSF
ncbi:hypothetical protein NXY33_22515, partial [Bacteroides fragilis]|nr:hypothetical protein [Bacteroides fragilis]